MQSIGTARHMCLYWSCICGRDHFFQTTDRHSGYALKTFVIAAVKEEMPILDDMREAIVRSIAHVYKIYGRGIAFSGIINHLTESGISQIKQQGSGIL